MAQVGTEPTHKLSFGMVDYSGEKTRMQLHIPAIDDTDPTPLGYFTAATGKIDVLKAALALATKLNFTSTNVSIEADQDVESLPSNIGAQREIVLEIPYVDNVTGDKYRFNLPAPADGLYVQGSETVPLSNGVYSALVAVLEAECVSPNGNAITCLAGRIKFRRS